MFGYNGNLCTMGITKARELDIIQCRIQTIIEKCVQERRKHKQAEKVGVLAKIHAQF